MGLPPPAGAKIGASATATYTDALGQTVTVTSNVVESTVKAVYAVDLEAVQKRIVPAGTTVVFPHVVTNNGNIDDTFELDAENIAGDDGEFANIQILPDTNRDGIADSSTATDSTGKLAAGGTYGFVVHAQVPGSATSDDALKITVTANNGKSSQDAATDSNTHTVTIKAGAYIEITKTFSTPTAAPEETVTVTLIYRNQTAKATSLEITDDLSSQPLDFTANSTQWSKSTSPSTAINDGNQGTASDSSTLAVTNTSSVVKFVISTVPANSDGEITFEITVPANAVPGTVLTNKASYTFDSNGDNSINSNDGDVDTNLASLTVTGKGLNITIADAVATANVASGPDGAGNLSNNSNDKSETDEDGSLNDTVEVRSDLQTGATVPFQFILTNIGNGAGRVNLNVDNDATNGFPSGTVFSLTDADGLLLTDTDGDGNPDIAIGDKVNLRLYVRATLPNSAKRSDTATAWSAKITATPFTGDPADEATLSLQAKVGSTVDLINLTSSVNGDGSTTDPTGSAGFGVGSSNETNTNEPFTTLNAERGQTAVFKLRLTTTVATTFDLEASYGNTRLTSTGYAANNLVAFPKGIRVVLKDTDGNIISSTGPVIASGSFDFEAHVTVDAGADVGNVDIRFRVYSPTIDGLEDQKLDRVSIGRIIDISLWPNESSHAIAPGQVAIYTFDLRNNGNVDIKAGDITVNGVPEGYTATLNYDTDNSGAVDNGEPEVDNINDIDADGIAKGDAKQLILTVVSPLSAIAGEVKIRVSVAIDLKEAPDEAIVDGNPENNNAVFTTAIVRGKVQLVAEQAMDTDCNGTIEGNFNSDPAASPMPVSPGDCIQYQITATVSGSNAVSVTVTTRTPPYTELVNCGGLCNVRAEKKNKSAIAGITKVPSDNIGKIEAVFGDLSAGTTRILRFTVKVNDYD